MATWRTLLPRLRMAAFFLVAACLLAPATAGAAAFPSPADWSREIIYFLLLDRFANGDPSNDRQTANGIESGPQEHRYNGGDFKGATARLDYLKALGVTAVWISPPVLNQWWDGSIPYAGYHGYWASHHGKLDPHWGSLDDYRRFVREAHVRGLRVIQDIAPNHTGNYFRIDRRTGALTRNRLSVPGWPDDPLFRGHLANRLAGKGEQWAFHWTPDLADPRDPVQLTTWQSSGLDDINTDDPRVAAHLRICVNSWIREVDIDGLRIDTVRNVPRAFWKEFTHKRDATVPEELGVREYARRLGKADFFVFGEVHTDDDGTAASYTRDDDGSPILDGVLHYPLYWAMQNAFKHGGPTAAVARALENRSLYRDPSRLVTFLDNHDNPRLADGLSRRRSRLTLAALLTLPGIPCIYYGTEQEFTVPRAAMFKGGYKGGQPDRDEFDAKSPGFRFLRALIALRREQPALYAGATRILAATSTGPGILVIARNAPGQRLLLLFNTSPRNNFAYGLPTGAAPGATWRNLLSSSLPDMTAGVGGTLSLVLPAHSFTLLGMESGPGQGEGR